MGERAVASLKISRSDVVEYQCAFLEVAAGEAVLDEDLLRAQPVEGGVDLAHPNGAEAQSLAEGMAGRGGIEHASGGEFGGGVEQPGDDQGEDEIAAALGRAAGEQAIEADTAGGGEGGEDMAMPQRAAGFETPLTRGDEPVPTPGGPQ